MGVAIVVTIDADGFGLDGVKNTVTGSLAFDSSYPTGGESLTPPMVGLRHIEAIDVRPQAGFVFEYDYDNELLLAYRSAGFTPEGSVAAPTFTGDSEAFPPGVVYEESVTSASNVATLTWDAAHIWYISNDTKPFIIVDKGTTPGAGEVAVDFTPATGTTSLTFAAADSDPTVFVTYWPALSNRMLAGGLVESDLVDATPAAGHASISGEVITITGGAAAIIAVDVDGTAFKPLIDDDTAAAGEYEVLWDSTGDTVLTGSGTEFSAATAITITFITPHAAMNFVEDGSAHSSDVVTIVNDFYIPRTSCYLYSDDNDNPHTIHNSSETLEADQVKVDIRQVAGVKFTYHADTDVAASGIPYVAMDPLEVTGFQAYTPAGTNSAPAFTGTAVAAASLTEVANATDLSSLTAVRFRASGI